MNNTSNLFENLMLMHESDKESGRKVVSKKKLKKIDENSKRIDEADTTLLNLTVEIPTDTEDIEPEDVKVDVGVMPIETEETPEDGEPTEDETDVTPEDEIEEETPEDTEENEEEEPEKEESLQLEGKDCKCTGEEDCECEACKAKKEATDVDSAKKRIIARANGEDEGIIDGISNAIGSGISGVANAVFGGKNESAKTESLMHLDTTSLNKLITNFVRDNYKNIDKVVINKAMLENHKLTLKGFIKNTDGLKESITLVNRGFDGTKLENKRFLIDFADANNTFGVMKESVKKPFIFTASLKEGNLKFESLKYNFKTRIDESKVAEISGDCVLTESLEPVMEDANQVKKFNEIVDKIKAAKSANDLTACKDEMTKAKLGDTLLSAAQMVWDDVNSRMKG